jgi:hypothetical protein
VGAELGDELLLGGFLESHKSGGRRREPVTAS